MSENPPCQTFCYGVVSIGQRMVGRSQELDLRLLIVWGPGEGKYFEVSWRDSGK